MEENTVKVVVPPNIRVLDDYDTDLNFQAGQTYILIPRHLRSRTLQAALMDGRLRVVEGTLKFLFKDSMVIINGVPSGNTYVDFAKTDGTGVLRRDLTTNKVAPLASETPSEAPESIETPAAAKPKSSKKKK